MAFEDNDSFLNSIYKLARSTWPTFGPLSQMPFIFELQEKLFLKQPQTLGMVSNTNFGKLQIRGALLLLPTFIITHSNG